MDHFNRGVLPQETFTLNKGTNMKQEYEVGGRVKISGKWYEIEANSVLGTAVSLKIEGEPSNWWTHASFIEAYEPPKKEEVFEWITSEHWDEAWESIGSGDNFRIALNESLLKTYGDPTVRTYNGEKAEEFGLTDESSVLIWEMEQWEMYRFRGIGKDDKWRKLPAAPKGGE